MVLFISHQVWLVYLRVPNNSYHFAPQNSAPSSRCGRLPGPTSDTAASRSRWANFARPKLWALFRRAQPNCASCFPSRAFRDLEAQISQLAVNRTTTTSSLSLSLSSPNWRTPFFRHQQPKLAPPPPIGRQARW